MMRSDDAGVGGFAEDLPVMVFVLAGVCLLVGSAVSVVEGTRDDSGVRMECLAELLVGHVIDGVECSDLPTVQGLRSLDLAGLTEGIGARCDGYYVLICLVHPWVEELNACGSLPDSRPSATGSFSCLVNALGDDTAVTVVEVRAIVW